MSEIDADVEALKAQFLNRAFDEKRFVITEENAVAFALACGETAPKFTNPAHPDFQAPPTFPSSLVAGRQLPADFPRYGIGMDAGKAVAPKKPVRPGVELVGRSHIHDIYTKTGRSGRMLFVVIRMDLYDPAGELVAAADTRAVMRERGATE